MTRVDHNEFLFVQLVIQNQQKAMMSLCEIKNPASDKTEINLEFAKSAIDTLGNLSKNEEQFLNDTIRDLKLIYVAENKKE
jgi:vesicle coat complex subunit